MFTNTFVLIDAFDMILVIFYHNNASLLYHFVSLKSMYFNYRCSPNRISGTPVEPPGVAEKQLFTSEGSVLTVLHQTALIGPSNHMGLSIDQ